MNYIFDYYLIFQFLKKSLMKKPLLYLQSLINWKFLMNKIKTKIVQELPILLESPWPNSKCKKIPKKIILALYVKNLLKSIVFTSFYRCNKSFNSITKFVSLILTKIVWSHSTAPQQQKKKVLESLFWLMDCFVIFPCYWIFSICGRIRLDYKETV